MILLLKLKVILRFLKTPFDLCTNFLRADTNLNRNPFLMSAKLPPKEKRDMLCGAAATTRDLKYRKKIHLCKLRLQRSKCR